MGTRGHATWPGGTQGPPAPSTNVGLGLPAAFMGTWPQTNLRALHTRECMHTHADTHTCTHMQTHTRMHTQTLSCTSMHILAPPHKDVHTHECTSMLTDVHAHTCMHEVAHTRAHTCRHTLACTHLHPHACTRTCMRARTHTCTPTHHTLPVPPQAHTHTNAPGRDHPCAAPSSTPAPCTPPAHGPHTCTHARQRKRSRGEPGAPPYAAPGQHTHAATCIQTPARHTNTPARVCAHTGTDGTGMREHGDV